MPSPPRSSVVPHPLVRITLTGFDLRNRVWEQHLSGALYERLGQNNIPLSEPGETHFLSPWENGGGSSDSRDSAETSSSKGTGASAQPWLPRPGDSLHARIDPNSLHWKPKSPGVACFLVDFRTLRDKAHPGCPRGHLRRVAARLESAGLHPWASTSWTFGLAFRGDALAPSDASEFLANFLEDANAKGIPVERLGPVGQGQMWRSELADTNALGAGDDGALFRHALGEAAAKARLTLRYGPKGGLLRLGLSVGTPERNLFVPPKGKQPFSPEGRRFLESLRGSEAALEPALHPSAPASRDSGPRLEGAGLPQRTHAVLRCSGEAQPHLALAAAFAAGAWGLDSPSDSPASLAELLGHPLADALSRRRSNPAPGSGDGPFNPLPGGRLLP